MGSACCVASGDRTLPQSRSGEGVNRNVRHSPSWSFLWDNRRRVAGEIDYPTNQSCGRINKDVRMEMNACLGSDTGNIFASERPVENLGPSLSQNSPSYEGVGLHALSSSDLSTASRHSAKVKNSETSATDPAQHSISMPSSSSKMADTFCFKCRLLPVSTIPSRLIQHSPSHHLFGQVSDSQFQRLQSPNNNSISDGRPSFVLSPNSNDVTTCSYGGSSDGWSLHTFSELVSSSRRERWSFDSEHFGSGRSKICGSSSTFLSSPFVNLQTCGACTRHMSERVSISGHELSVAAVLVCGHVYHAACLENLTPEADKYDPACPVCTIEEREVSEISRKALRAEAELKMKFPKISKNRVRDSCLASDFDVTEHGKISPAGKLLKMEGSSSSKMSFAKPFFSPRSKWGRSASENDPAKKTLFCARYRKS
ncbi:hypothetical protein Nepgr_015752 [Nepenthes gracilis]|uniref:RING-type domain-containing protein n=1 Tax=Nepenthes gracilis TaxID=150966 RepID=A0AAD3SP20_NEPGR|nr:hypothetical protein Nepgr_015752 [Nepenthes gracilis]